jgi:FKBP-type peptidyl-prolyl cis-trans isomerase 2
VQAGDLVEIEYTGTLANGSVFDSSKERGPFQFVVGTGSAIIGFDTQIKGMTIGQSKKFTLTPDEAYGEYDPTLIQAMPIGFIPQGENVTIGDTVTLFNGQAYFPATIIDLNATNVTFDLNHQLAGQSLTFDVKLVNLTPAKEVEAMMEQYQNEAVQLPADVQEPAALGSGQQAGAGSNTSKTL